MKHIIIFSIILTSLISAKEEAAKDFREAVWGMSAAEVKKCETEELLQEKDNMLKYKGVIAGIDCSIYYTFFKDKLIKAKYVFKVTDGNQSIKDYKKLLPLMKKKYGKPVNEKVIWKDDLYKGHAQNHGRAISLGHLVYMADWDTETTLISLNLFGKNPQITFGLFYDSKALKDLKKTETEKDNMKGL